MTRPARLVSLALLALAACERPEVRVSPSSISALEGVRTVVRVDAELGCDDPGEPVLERADGSPAGAAFAVEVRAFSGGDASYYIGNPGQDRDIPGPGPGPGPGDPVPVTPDTGRLATIDTGDLRWVYLNRNAFELLVEPAPGTSGPHALRVRVAGCGTDAAASLTVNVVGAVELGPFCGVTSGAACEGDAGCERAGCGALCAAAGTRAAEELEARLTRRTPWCAPAADCADPVPTGATCGCVLGACSWRLP